MSDAVLIAAPERVPALATGELEGAVAFDEGDALAALEAIAHRPPRVIALEQTFADSPRGVALINRIKADPALHACELRIVGAASPPRPVPPSQTEAAAPLDLHGTRAAPRFDLTQPTSVTLDGNPVRLADLSVSGAEVVTRVTLRPNQRVRVTFRDAERPIRVGALVRWAQLEMAGDGPHFRAGLAFVDADAEALARYIEAHR